MSLTEERQNGSTSAKSNDTCSKDFLSECTTDGPEWLAKINRNHGVAREHAEKKQQQQLTLKNLQTLSSSEVQNNQDLKTLKLTLFTDLIVLKVTH